MHARPTTCVYLCVPSHVRVFGLTISFTDKITLLNITGSPRVLNLNITDCKHNNLETMLGFFVPRANTSYLIFYCEFGDTH